MIELFVSQISDIILQLIYAVDKFLSRGITPRASRVHSVHYCDVLLPPQSVIEKAVDWEPGHHHSHLSSRMTLGFTQVA